MKIVLTTSSLLSLVVAFAAGWHELNGTLLVGFLAFVALLFTAHLDQFEEFKASGTGIEAKTRAVITKAESTIVELQSLAKIFAETTLSSVKRAGRLGGYEDEEEERIKQSVLEVLSQIGVPESEREMVLSDWHRLTKYDYAYVILGSHTIPQGFDDPAVQTEWKALRNIHQIPTPDQLREFLSKWGVLDDWREELIKDYEHYLANGEHRRPDVWRERRNWGSLKKP